MEKIEEIRKAIEQDNATERSAWGRGVGVYALELVDGLQEWQEWNNGAEIPTDRKELEKALLNGAENWARFSDGGCSLVYDCDIAKRLCTPSELKRTRNGERNPNGRENWIECQARALFQAFRKVYRAVKETAQGVQ